MKFFTETLYDTQLGVLEVHFERVGNPSTTGYKTAIMCGTDATYNFLMQENEEGWRIDDVQGLPDWILQLEAELSDSISAHKTRSALEANTETF